LKRISSCGLALKVDCTGRWIPIQHASIFVAELMLIWIYFFPIAILDGLSESDF